MIARLLQSAALGLFVAANVHAQTPLPDWARARWDAFAVARSLQRSTQVREQTLTGDFDGDGLPDVAMVVEHRVTKKIGIVPSS